jgi:GTP-binding protein
MFDRVAIVVKAGDGGDGAVSFRREKFVPFGGPDGGDGGNGGSIVIMSDSTTSSLRQFQLKRFYRAGKGESGKGKKKHGRNGKDIILKVPEGTIVSQKSAVDEDALIADLERSGQAVVVAGGGKGGLGNIHFSSSTNQAPRIAQKGETVAEVHLVLELRLIADVGIIGYPNVGKSTLLAAASAAKPRIASYPFTTCEPVLGVVEFAKQSFVLAEIPGLIADAHLGRGLGHDFLRHIMRTKMLVHLIDGSAESPVEDMAQVNTELSLFDSALSQKTQIVAVNKIDLPQVKARLKEIEDAFSGVGLGVFFISAATGEGVSPLMMAAAQVLKRVAAEKEVGVKVPRKVFRPQPAARVTRVQKDGDTFVVTVPGLDRLFTGARPAHPEVRWQLKRRLARLGVSKALERAGIKPGDKVRCGNLELEW